MTAKIIRYYPPLNGKGQGIRGAYERFEEECKRLADEEQQRIERDERKEAEAFPKLPPPSDETRSELNRAMRQGERWKLFEGYLFSSGSYPDPSPNMVPTLAARYGITSLGRVIRIRKDGGISLKKERARCEKLSLWVNGKRWQPKVGVLLDRLFPEESDRWLQINEGAANDMANEAELAWASHNGLGHF